MTGQHIVLGHDIILWLIRGLELLDEDIDVEHRDAVINLLWNADVVALDIGLEPRSSLASRLK